MKEAKRLIADNAKSLAEAVRDGCEIVVPGPTCSYMLKQEYPWLDGSEDANLVAAHTKDLFEYLAGLHAEGRLDTRFPNPPGKIAYQLPCHLKAQNLGTKSADVLRLTGAEVETVERCSAVDGTWGLKKEYFELSMKLAGPLFRDIRQAAPDRIATDCPLAALRSSRGRGRRRSTRSESSPMPTGSASSSLERFAAGGHAHDTRQDRARRRAELLRVREGSGGDAAARHRPEAHAPRGGGPPPVVRVREPRHALFQIQEMCRVERITDDAKIQDEIDVYGALLPRPGELSATLMIEIADKEQIKPVLDRFMGIDTGQCVWLQVGKEFAVAGEFEAGHSDEEKGKLAAVHFVRFAFPAAAVRAFADSPVFLAVDHPAARARVELSAETRAALSEDLLG